MGVCELMTYAGPERRTNGVNIVVLETRLENIEVLLQDYREDIKNHRIEQNEYKEKIQELFDKVIENQVESNQRCAVRLATCETFKIHLSEHAKKKDWWKDKKAQILIYLFVGFINAMFGFIVGLWIHNITGK